jgi:hypothetical protein
LHIAKSGSRFKVLENYEYKGKTLILLLHLTDDEGWEVFKNNIMDIDSDIVSSSIERFKDKSFKEPVPELSSKDWLDRCEFPVGIDESGNCFVVE